MPCSDGVCQLRGSRHTMRTIRGDVPFRSGQSNQERLAPACGAVMGPGNST